jgi:hypothetical protein
VLLLHLARGTGAVPRCSWSRPEMPGASDGDLIAAAARGVGDAFGMLVELYERAVYHLALRTRATSRMPKTRPKKRGSRVSRRGCSPSATAFGAIGWPNAAG